jgi:hypothetical protein
MWQHFRGSPTAIPSARSKQWKFTGRLFGSAFVHRGNAQSVIFGEYRTSKANFDKRLQYQEAAALSPVNISRFLAQSINNSFFTDLSSRHQYFDLRADGIAWCAQQH